MGADEFEVSSRSLSGSEAMSFLHHARNGVPLVYLDACWRITRSELVPGPGTQSLYRTFVLVRVDDADCERVSAASSAVASPTDATTEGS